MSVGAASPRRSGSVKREVDTVARIPDKHYFKIGEVAELAGVEPYVIRYWESEFRSLRPQKSRSNQRLFRRKDVERILEIRRLLYEEGYKIEGARRRLEHGHDEAVVEAVPEDGDKSSKTKKAPSVSALRSHLAEADAVLSAIEKILDEDEAS
jgi:DNA-binding transcriptional MerR regulator